MNSSQCDLLFVHTQNVPMQHIFDEDISNLDCVYNLPLLEIANQWKIRLLRKPASTAVHINVPVHDIGTAIQAKNNVHNLVTMFNNIIVYE